MTKPTSESNNNFFIVAIGASAGGLQALESFFSNLPDSPNAAFVVVQHLSPDFKSMMTEILQRKTAMSVRAIEDEMKIEPSLVYVLPPKKHVVVKNRCFCLLESPESFDYPIDKFFRSLVKEWGEKTIAILLSGTGSDGTKGIKAISRMGGIGLVQSPETAQFNSMPSNAIPSGLVDEILSPQELAQTVFELIRYSENFPDSAPEEAVSIDSDRLQNILDILADREEIDFSHYKISTLSRRIHHRCALTHNGNLTEYIELLQESEKEQKLLRRDLSIGITQFFRDRPVWEFLEAEVLPKLIDKLQSQEQLRVWVSACATGEEAYSMAMLIDEAIAKSDKLIEVKIFATDIDGDRLETTARGIYPANISNDISAKRLEKYFTFTGNRYKVKRFLREMLIIAPHDLTKNAGFSKMNLVSCRNVLIYMQPQLQQHVLKLLHFALDTEGILFLGSSETLGDLREEFSTVQSKWKIFRKTQNTNLSMGQITRQPIVDRLPVSTHGKAKSKVFKYALGDRKITELEYELQQTRENLQVTIEELETTNEEQQATNEELLASNEELQSINEELYTVNAEHQAKIQELTQLNNDIDNLLRSTDIGVIFLNRDLHIRKFTPAATEAINIKPHDVGRPLADITNNLKCPNLPEILQQVIERQEPLEQEMRIARTGEQLLMRVNLYLRENGDNDGVVVTFIKIDELKRIQDELYRANSLLENLYRTSPAGLSLHDENLQYIRINQTLADINGFTVEEHMGKTIREIVPQLADTIEPILRQVRETNRPVCDLQFHGNTPAAPNFKRYWSASYYPVDLLDGKRGVGSVVIDITDRITAEQSLKESEANLLEAQQLAHLGNWEFEVNDDFNLDTASATWSAEMFRIYNLDPQQSVPTFSELIQLHPARDRKIIRSAFEKLLDRGTPYNLDLHCDLSNGETRYLNSIGRAIQDETGRVVKLYGAVMDITDRKQIERKLVRQNRALEEAIAVAQAADSANQAKSDFLANMSHEIRTPMNVILLVAQLLDRTELNHRQRNLLTTLRDNSGRLLSLIDDILNLSKIEARELKLNPQEFSLDTLTQNILDSFTPQAEEKGLSLSLNVERDLPQVLIGDDFRLQQVLNNLVTNAIKFTAQGEIAIAITSEAQTTSSFMTLRFSISDTGIGISPSQQENLFQPFTQADNSTTRQYGGTGLGLAISRRIIELMGGTIGLESVVGEGSTFWFTVPLEVAITKESIPEDTTPTPPKITTNASSTARILLVEDYPDNRETIIMMLEILDYKADSVNNGKEALDRLSQQQYDLVLMDCQMPIVDGYQTTQKLREREGKEKHTIIIGLTAHAMESDRQKCLDAGMDDYVSKPIDLDNFSNILQKWLNRSGC